MARQEELPGTEGPGRIPELHALWLELVALEEEAAEARGAVKAKREEAAAALHKRGLTEYFIDGAELWIEPSEKVKAKKKGGRKKGKIVKVIAGDDEGPPAVDAGVRDRLDAAASEDETEN